MKPNSKILEDLKRLREAKAEDIELSNEDMPEDPQPTTADKFYINYTIEEWIPGTDQTKFVSKHHEFTFDSRTYQGLVLNCLAAVQTRKNPAMTLDNYLRCWTQDMAENLAEAGVTFSQLIADVKSRLYSEASSPTMSDLVITSLSSFKPTKMASQTSLL